MTFVRAICAVVALLLVTAPDVVHAQSLPGLSTSDPAPPDTSEALERLLEVLRDDTARAALIARLESDLPQEGQTASADRPNIAQRAAVAAVAAVQGLTGDIARLGRELARLGTLFDRLAAGDSAAIRAEALPLALTIGATVAVFLLLAGIADRMARRLAPGPLDGLPARLRGTAVTFGARLVALILGLAAGYAMAATLFAAPDGNLTTAQSLYLNAFLLFGLVRITLRTVASPRADHEPVLSRLAPEAQAVIYRRLRTIAGVTIQGFLFVLPLMQLWAGFAAARPLRSLLATLAAVLALLAIRRIHRVLDIARNDRAGPSDRMGQAGKAVADGAQSVWRRAWPLLATVYVVHGWFVTMTRPAQAAEIVVGGTVYTAAALALLLGGLALLRAAPSIRAPLPQLVLGAVPRLGPRATVILAAVTVLVAATMAVLAVALAVAGWTRFDLADTLSQPTAQTIQWQVLSALIVALAAAAVWAVTASWIDARLTNVAGGTSARSRTLLALFRNAFTIVVAVLAVMVTLSQLGIDIAPLIAGAGVIGLAIGFGSQKLVQDIITGVFIQLENAINEGDVVGVAGITGGVEKVTIRSVRLRTLDGAAHIVPFSSVDTVTNLTRDFSFHLAEIGVAYKEKVPKVKEAMFEAFDRLLSEGFGPDILEPLEMQGVIQLGDSAVVVRARIKTLPGKQWGAGRRFTELVKDVFDERGIEIPFPHRQLVFPSGLAALAEAAARPAPPGGGSAIG